MRTREASRHSRTVLFAGVLPIMGVLLVAACRADAAGEGASARDATHDDAPPAELGMLTSSTPAGIDVELSLEPDPPRPDSLRLSVWVPDGAIGSNEEPSVDLVAPRMPTHGIVRYPLQRADDQTWVADVWIPMEGLWAVYVNLNRGSEAAPFEFHVPGEGETGTGPSHSYD